jgi:ABC-type enterochelin transport system permease subunit
MYFVDFWLFCRQQISFSGVIFVALASCTINISHFLQKLLDLEKHSSILHSIFSFFTKSSQKEMSAAGCQRSARLENGSYKKL